MAPIVLLFFLLLSMVSIAMQAITISLWQTITLHMLLSCYLSAIITGDPSLDLIVLIPLLDHGIGFLLSLCMQKLGFVLSILSLVSGLINRHGRTVVILY